MILKMEAVRRMFSRTKPVRQALMKLSDIAKSVVFPLIR